MKRFLFFISFCLVALAPLAAQQVLNIKPPQEAIDTTAEVLGFANASGCFRFSMPLTMEGAEGSIQLETSGNGYMYIYSDSQAVVSFSVASCEEQGEYFIMNLNPNAQQGNLSPVQRIIMVRNGNFACGYSPIVFDFGEDVTESLYCSF